MFIILFKVVRVVGMLPFDDTFPIPTINMARTCEDTSGKGSQWPVKGLFRITHAFTIFPPFVSPGTPAA